MKKLFFSLIATVMISTCSFANTNEIEKIKEVNLIEVNETALADSKELIEEDVWICREVGRTVTTNDFSGETTVTVYIRCVWIQ
ncbi:hypothetical protein [Flavobacterium sp.]|uniref:hypothetical protein n=1 Tax=Flavobacterium sp. TaxID=239 RepID=UPI004047A934